MLSVMDQSRAEAFAKEWIDAWNAHDLVRILSHYSEDIVFHSPRIAAVMGTKQTYVSGKDLLRAYWQRALTSAPQLRFELERIYVGSDTLTIAYRNHRGQSAAETFVFDADGRVKESMAAYV
jgi:ketosteroid isomerase-like protein